MTNTLHRFGDADSFRDDYVVFAIASRGKNEENSVPKLKKFLEMAKQYYPVNLGDARNGGALRPSKSMNPLAHWNRDARSPVLFERLVKKFLNLGAPDQAAIAKGIAAYEKEAKMLDAHLAKEKYLVGGTLTIADFAAAAPLFYAKEVELPLTSYSHMRGWFERVSALPCWRETAPQMAAAA